MFNYLLLAEYRNQARGVRVIKVHQKHDLEYG